MLPVLDSEQKANAADVTPCVLTRGRNVKYVRDVLFKYIALTEDELKVIDTPEFQALRNIRQLAAAHYVFPSATHTRFQHSLQVCHLAGLFVETLAKNQPELKITRRTLDLVRVAAICHDLGHTCFSHSFDHYVAPQLKIKWPRHEERSTALFVYMVRKYSLQYSEDEVELVSHLIRGERWRDYPRWLFQIVANKDFEIDADKLCYLALDSYMIGLPRDLQSERIMEHARVIDDSICFHYKTAELIVDIFRCRADMHHKIYKHRATVAIEAMVCDMLAVLAQVCNWELLFNSDTHDWRSLNDGVLDDIPKMWASAAKVGVRAPHYAVLQRAHRLYSRLCRRQLYSCRERRQGDSSLDCVRKESNGCGDAGMHTEQRGQSAFKEPDGHTEQRGQSAFKNPDGHTEFPGHTADTFKTSMFLEHGFGGDSNPLDKVVCYEVDRTTGAVLRTRPILQCNLSTVALNVPVHRQLFELDRS